MAVDTITTVSLTATREPTAQLRWTPCGPSEGLAGLKLQQTFKITTFHDGEPNGVSFEWRDVPTGN